MPVHSVYRICNHCRLVGVYQRVADGVWCCRYCGAEATDETSMVDERLQCLSCGETLPRGAKQAYDFLYANPRSINGGDLAEILEAVAASNELYLQGMSPNSAFLAGLHKLTGIKAEHFVQAVQHVRRYHHGSQRRSINRARKAARKLANVS